jgi:subtilisin-like proprotein convertase family protein
MSLRSPGSNTVVSILKSMVAKDAGGLRNLLRTRSNRRKRSLQVGAVTEVCETRMLLTLTVGPNVNLSRLPGNQDESAIIVNPNNSQQLFASSNNAAGGLFAARSIDGGATWLTSNGPDWLIADGNDSLVSACCDPTLAWDTFGNLYISYISGDLQSIPIAISTDGGATFSQLTSIGGGNVDQPTITTGPGLNGAGQALWITYAQGGTQARGAAVSGLGAANVGPLGAAQAVVGVNQFGDIVVGPNGQVVVTGQNTTQIQVGTDPDGLGPLGFSGAVIATTTNVDRFDAIPSQPLRSIDAEAGLAYDRSGGVNNGRLYLVYTDEIVDENNDTDIFVRISNDNGATWGSRIRVNDDATTNSQWFGKIAVDQTNGDIGITFYDARNSLTNTTVQLWGTISNDGGLTWDANTRISGGTINGTVAATGGQQLGDYIGLTFNAGRMHPTWSDNSNSTFNNPDGTLRQLDIYTATVLAAPAPLVFTVSQASVSENADGLVPGSAGVRGTVRRPAGSSNAQPLVVTLTSSDLTEIQLPATVTIPAGVNFRTFQIDVIDDNILDGTQVVTLTADAVVAGSPVTGSATISVLDAESFSFTVSANTVREDAGDGALTATITRSDIDTVPANVYVVADNRLDVYDSVGALVSTRLIPWPGGLRPASEYAHDLITLPNGKIAVYNGTTTAYLSIFTPTTQTWQHFPIVGLSTDADIATGGITAWGNYVFVSDTGTGADPFGIVRYDLTTGATARFGNLAPDYRLFVKSVTGPNITEVDAVTGATLNTIPMPVLPGNNFGFNNGLAFDGTDLWVLAGGIGNDAMYRIDANTGAVLQIHHLGGTDSWDGLAYLNGLLYAVRASDNGITVYDPKLQRSIKTLNVGAANGINISGGLAGLATENKLVVTSSAGFPNEVFLINPQTGAMESRWSTGLTAAAYGLATANGKIFLGDYGSADLKVFSPTGVPLGTLTVAAGGGVFALGGDDVKGMRTSTYRYRDVFAGFDNSLYALDVVGTVVGQYDPTSLNLVRYFNVAMPVNAIAVAADGTVWGAGRDGNLYHFSSTGSVLETRTSGAAELIDIDLNITGQLLLTSRDGSVIRMHTAMISMSSFVAGTSEVFVTLGVAQTLPAGDVVVQLTSSDTTELTVQQFVVIPVGQLSVMVPINAVDDKILDGTQSVVITASSVGFLDITQRIDVLDAEQIGVDIVATQISEAAGNAATQVRVFRTNVDGPFPFVSQQTASNTVSQTIVDFDKITSQIAVPSQTSRLTDVNVTLSLKHTWLADLDIFLISPWGTRVELVTDLNSNAPFMTNTTFDDSALGSILAGSSPFTGKFRPEGSLLALNGENPSGLWTLEITDDNRQDFGTLFSWSLDFQTMGLAPQVVTLSLTGAPGKISVQETVTIPANQAEIFVPVNAIDNMLLDGTQIAGIRAAANAPGFEFSNDNVTVLDEETLTLEVTVASISEAAGPAALFGKLTRGNTDISLPFTVLLSSSNTGKLTVQSSVTIPANMASVSFPINAIDNSIIDGDIPVTITASAPAYGDDKTVVVIVLDFEPVLKLTTATPVVSENGVSFTVKVERQDQIDLSAPLVVNLSASLGLTVPSTVTIPATKVSETFIVNIVDNAKLEGSRTANIHATGNLITDGDLSITITDYEQVTVSVNKSSILENAGPNAAIGTVTRGNTENPDLALVVSLSSSDLTELKVPASVTIPAGQLSATFQIEAINDTDLDGTQAVIITATSTGYVNGTVNIDVLDHEPPILTGPTAATPLSKPTITWTALAGAIRYDVWISNMTTGVSQTVRDINVPTNSFVPPENLGIGRYRVWVRAINQQEITGFWSVGSDFFVNTPPVITSPSPTVSFASSKFPTITWSAVPDATEYELWVNNLTTNRPRVIYRAGAVALTTTSYTSQVELPSGTYKIWVRGLNTQGEAGLWSAGVVHTVLAPPAIMQPIGGGTFDRTPTFSWTAVTGATNYDLWVGDGNTNAVVIRNKFVTTTSYTAMQDMPVGDYRVWVRAQSENSYSSWSKVTLFSVGLPPIITSAKLVGTPARAQFAWTTIAGTEKYELLVKNKTTRVLAISQTALTNTAYTHNSTLAAGTYRVWIRAVSTMGEVTAWSSAVELIVTSAERPLGVLEPLQATVLTSRITQENQLTGNKSSIEPLVAIVDETPIVADKNMIVSNNINAMDGVMASVETVTQPTAVTASEFDAVMAEWQSADWWVPTAESSDKKELKSAAVLAASLGLVVRKGNDSEERRKQKLR